MSARPERREPTVWVLLALVAGVLLCYGRVGSAGFVSYDDGDYVLENPWVKNGLTWEGVRWALGSSHASNWHPLTWLAHMLDVELFGLEPAGHHWTNVALHAANAALCFLALRSLTRAFYPAAAVAALFALHPLRVESVAWVSERKDLLAGFFFFLLLLCHGRHARAPGAGRFALVVLVFALGLLAKPMLVTAPLVLLLLDRWPLGRLRSARAAPSAHALPPAAPPSLAPTHPGEAPRRTGDAGGGFLPIAEKLPLLFLAVLSSWITVVSQREGGALHALEAFPLDERLANAPQAVLRYLAHFAWPFDLAYFYPHSALVAPERATPWTAGALAALLAVLALSVLALRARHRLPAVFVGWYWFLGMLVPVLGLVQVGEQALADRYAYLPMVGVQIALVFALAELRLGARGRALLAAATGIALLGLGAATWTQTQAWRDSEALYRHALEVTPANYAAHLGLANELAERGDVEAAREHYEEALEIHPDYAPALYGLGLLEQETGHPERAIELYRRAIQALPSLAEAHLNLGMLLAQDGELVDAALEFEAVLVLDPEHPDAHFNLAQLLLLHGRTEAAIEHLESSVRVRPDAPSAWEKLGEAHEATGRHAESLRALEQALRAGAGWSTSARLAWLLATAREDELRDAPRALELAREAVRASGRQDPDALEALAAAWAENGDFARAGEIQEEALQRLAPGRQASARARLDLYRSGAPFRHEH